MSELKATTVYDAYWTANSVGEGTGIQVYLKSEADKVIAEKDAKILALEAEVAKQKHHAKLFFDERNYAEIQLRRQKYKRCLAMARWCKMSARENDTRMCLPEKQKFTKHEEYLYFIGYYHKWHRRWLELAQKFKEGK